MKQKRFGTKHLFFSLVELLVVMAIIGIIAALLLPALSKVRAMGKQTACLSNLRQIGTGMQLYKTDSNMNPVPWTSLLFPEYISSNKVYQCPADLNPTTRAADSWRERIDNQYDQIYDKPSPDNVKNVGLNGYRHNNDALNVSYFYEMSNMQYSAGTTWAMYKEDQLNHGNAGQPYSVSAFPIYRCFWHIKHIKNYSASPGKQIPNTSDPVISITYSGNYVLSKARWEDGVWSP